MKTAIQAAVAMWALSLTGCGAWSNLGDKAFDRPEFNPIYGGTKLSLTGAKVSAEGFVHPKAEVWRPVHALFGIYCLVVDTPLSAALDTLLMPLYLIDDWNRAKRKAEQEKEEQKEAESNPEAAWKA